MHGAPREKKGCDYNNPFLNNINKISPSPKMQLEFKEKNGKKNKSWKWSDVLDSKIIKEKFIDGK